MQTFPLVIRFSYNRSRRAYAAHCYSPMEAVPQGEIAVYTIDDISAASPIVWEGADYTHNALEMQYTPLRRVLARCPNAIGRVLSALNAEYANREKNFRTFA